MAKRKAPEAETPQPEPERRRTAAPELPVFELVAPAIDPAPQPDRTIPRRLDV